MRGAFTEILGKWTLARPKKPVSTLSVLLHALRKAQVDNLLF